MNRHKTAILSMLRFCEPLAGHTTFGIGGRADIWAQPVDVDSLAAVVRLCRQDGLPVKAIGNGSNVLVKDSGVSGCVLNLNAEGFAGVGINGDYATAGAGAGMGGLLSALCDEGLGGLEFLAGIPATAGGAVVTNAGCGEKNIGGFVEEARVMDERGRVFVLAKNEIVFRYRGSNLERFIVLEVKLRLAKTDKRTARQRLRQRLAEKSQSQELGAASAGCVFKNPANDSAGRLIDSSGLKGARVGGAIVSLRHANFIINTGGATSGDVLALMEMVQKKVKHDHGVLLEPEIEVFG